jgi:hypothetical protein
MSREKQKYRKGRVKPLEVEKLLYGENYLHKSGLKTDAKCRVAWEKHGDYILSHYRDRRPRRDDNTFMPLTYKSGQRPWGWWQFQNSHGMRKLVSGEVEPLSDELYFGKYRFIKLPQAKYEYESEFDFLKRHDLLFENEEESYLMNLANEKHLNKMRKQLMM